MTMVSPSLKCRMCNWQAVVPRCPPWATPLITMRTGAANAFAAIGIEGDRFLALGDQILVDDVEHFQKGHVRR